jgi:hypothetical protein
MIRNAHASDTMSSVRATEQLRSVLTTTFEPEGATARGFAEGLVRILAAAGISKQSIDAATVTAAFESCAPLAQRYR